MKDLKVKNIARQAGMTLIELTVVLMILIGLAGLLVPYVSGFLEKTHDSTTVSTISDLNSTIGRYQAAKLSLPSQLELLNDGTVLYSKLGNDGSMLQVVATGAAGGSELAFANASLFKAGVRAGMINDNSVTNNDATFKSTSGAPVNLDANPFAAATIPLTFLRGAAGDQTFFGQLATPDLTATTPALTTAAYTRNQLAYAFGGTAASWDTACTSYVVMGIGADSTLIPDAMQGAPVHFGGSKGTNPATKYSRYVAVFAVPNAGALAATSATSDAIPKITCPKPDAAAKFIGAAGIMDFPALVGLSGAQQWANINLYKD